MSDNNNELLTQILQTLNTFQVQTTKAINDLREEVRENKREILYGIQGKRRRS